MTNQNLENALIPLALLNLTIDIKLNASDFLKQYAY